jgi:serine O-acetyltransferase
MPGPLRRAWAEVRRDVAAARQRDPASRSDAEVVLCYPGVHAVWGYRLAHRLWTGDRKLTARLLSQLVRAGTGVEIHPGATIGPGLFIDHGAGVVIGETAEVGADVTLYQGVTLGGATWERGKRHPTVGDRVTVGAGAKVLGPIEIGHDSRIGANAVVVKPVPPNSVVVGVPGQIVVRTRTRDHLAPGALGDESQPDLVGSTLHGLLDRVDELETTLHGHLLHQGVRPGDDGVWSGGDFSI